MGNRSSDIGKPECMVRRLVTSDTRECQVGLRECIRSLYEAIAPGQDRMRCAHSPASSRSVGKPEVISTNPNAKQARRVGGHSFLLHGRSNARGGKDGRKKGACGWQAP